MGENWISFNGGQSFRLILLASSSCALQLWLLTEKWRLIQYEVNGTNNTIANVGWAPFWDAVYNADLDPLLNPQSYNLQKFPKS